MQTETITGRDIVIVGQQPWDITIGSNCKNIAIELSKYNRVLYVNSAMDRSTAFRNPNDPKIIKRKKIIKGYQAGLEKISTNLWTYYPNVMIESVNWIRFNWLFNFLNKRNNQRFAKSIQEAINRLDFKNFILFNDNDIIKSFYLIEYLSPQISIYYSRDYMLGVDYWKRHGSRLEPLLISKNTICVANSVYLSEYCKKFNPRSYFIGQGCDLDMFNTKNALPKFTSIGDIPGVKIGYVGALQSIRLNIELIAQLALQRPDYKIILVGPEDEDFAVSPLHQIPNIIFLGSQQVDDLPRIINEFDVCINPQLINEVTIGNYPRKIDEYLAMGKPVVAMYTEGMRMFERVVYCANNQTQFIAFVDRALHENTMEKREERINLANTHSWANSVTELSKVITATVK